MFSKERRKELATIELERRSVDKNRYKEISKTEHSAKKGWIVLSNELWSLTNNSFRVRLESLLLRGWRSCIVGRSATALANHWDSLYDIYARILWSRRTRADILSSPCKWGTQEPPFDREIVWSYLILRPWSSNSYPVHCEEPQQPSFLVLECTFVRWLLQDSIKAPNTSNDPPSRVAVVGSLENTRNIDKVESSFRHSIVVRGSANGP